MGAWLDALQLFSCICQVPLIPERIPENADGEAGEVRSGRLDFCWALGPAVFRGLTSTCLPRPGSTPALGARVRGGQCQQAQASERLRWKQLLA